MATTSEQENKQETDTDSEISEDEQPEKKRKVEDKFCKFELKDKTIHCTCTKCKKDFQTADVKTLLLPIDLYSESSVELQRGHLQVGYVGTFKRRTFVECPHCQEQLKLDNECLDKQDGKLVGSLQNEVCDDDKFVSDELKRRIVETPGLIIRSNLNDI